jgi:hypothetical protein
MLSQKLLVGVGIDTFASENRYLRLKSTAQSARVVLFTAAHRSRTFIPSLGQPPSGFY